MMMHKLANLTRVAHLGCYNSPPLKESRPRFLWRCKESGILGSEKVFAFPSCLFLGMIRPKDLDKLDRTILGLSYSFIKDANWMLMIGKVNCTAWIFEALLEL
jgi:hypothetical protein